MHEVIQTGKGSKSKEEKKEGKGREESAFLRTLRDISGEQFDHHLIVGLQLTGTVRGREGGKQENEVRVEKRERDLKIRDFFLELTSYKQVLLSASLQSYPGSFPSFSVRFSRVDEPFIIYE